jgi:hypothetical protein
MAQESSNLSDKRQQALQRLRNRRGSGRTSTVNWRDTEVEEAKFLVKGYKAQKSLNRDAEVIEPEEAELQAQPEIIEHQAEPEVAGIEEVVKVSEPTEEEESAAELVHTPTLKPETEQQLPKKISRVAKRLNKQEQTGLEALERLKNIMQSRRVRQKQLAAEGQSDLVVQLSQVERQQLLGDLLSTDFLQNTTQWLSSAPVDPELTSSSPQEIEAIHKQVLYRHRVLKVMLDATQQELDGIELYLRNYNVWRSQHFE